MTNPYEAPKSVLLPKINAFNRARGSAWLIAGLICSVIAASAAVLIVPSFIELFVGFGVDLPRGIGYLLRYYLGFWLVPALVIGAWMFWPAAEKRAFASGLIGIGALVVGVPVMVAALYLPIFFMGGKG